MGGLAPNTRAAFNRESHVSSRVQFHPKGSGPVLPSVAQGKNFGVGEGKGFPDVSGSGHAQLVNRAQEAAPSERYWNNWSRQNEGKLADFRTNRIRDWNNISEFRKTRTVAASYNKPEWNNYKNDVQHYRNNRAIETNNQVKNSFDDHFNSSWWIDRGWNSARGYRDYADRYREFRDYDKYWGYGEKYWWWEAATYEAVESFLGSDEETSQSEDSYQSDASDQSNNYDYGVNVVYEGDEVYINGTPVASSNEYSQQAIALANTARQPPASPMPPEPAQEAKYLPLGVWAMVQEENGDAYMFFQISIDKNGVVTGAFENLLTGETSPISGQVDEKSERVAWKVGSNNTVIETGLRSLTQDVASCLVHFGTDTTQTWLLVRMKEPEMPNAPQSATDATNSR